MTYPSHDLAIRYLMDLNDPDVTPEKIQEALDWIHSSEENRSAFETAQQFWAACEGLPPQITSSSSAPWSSNNPFLGLIAHVKSHLLLVAASILLAVVTAALATKYITFENEQPRMVAALEFNQDYSSPVGELHYIKLPDGSQITLGGASHVSVTYTKKERRITLDSGEGLFDVAKAPDRPFIVSAGGGHVVAVGTKFDVRRALDRTVVTLLHGIVNVETDPDRAPKIQAKLEPGMQVSYRPDGEMSPLRTVAVDDVTGWQRGVLTFSDEPLSSVIFEINRNTARSIRIDDANIRTLRVSGTIHVSNLSMWLQGLATVLPVRVVNAGGTEIHLQSMAER